MWPKASPVGIVNDRIEGFQSRNNRVRVRWNHNPFVCRRPSNPHPVSPNAPNPSPQMKALNPARKFIILAALTPAVVAPAQTASKPTSEEVYVLNEFRVNTAKDDSPHCSRQRTINLENSAWYGRGS